MITPVIINKLQWKAYLIFMCTNLAFVPLVYFCYPETANLTLEGIDHLFMQPGRSSVEVAREVRKQRKYNRGGSVDEVVTSDNSGEFRAETVTMDKVQ